MENLPLGRTAAYSSLVKLQPWCLNLVENSDDDDGDDDDDDDTNKTKNTENYFLYTNYPINSDSVRLLVLECSINPQYLMKIIKAIFVKIEILHFFFLM